jgi:hypothetical protein
LDEGLARAVFKKIHCRRERGGTGILRVIYGQDGRGPYEILPGVAAFSTQR